MKLDEEDLKIEVIPSKVEKQHVRTKPVLKVVHLPTNFSVVFNDYHDYEKNKKEAIKRLEYRVNAKYRKDWLKWTAKWYPSLKEAKLQVEKTKEDFQGNEDLHDIFTSNAEILVEKIEEQIKIGKQMIAKYAIEETKEGEKMFNNKPVDKLTNEELIDALMISVALEAQERKIKLYKNELLKRLSKKGERKHDF